MSADEAAAMIPPRRSGVRGLREEASGCRACPLWRNATQTVFGGGTSSGSHAASAASTSAPRRSRSTPASPGYRGKALSAEFAPAVVATFHPSSVLRAPKEDRDDAFAALVDDLRALREAA